MTQVINIRELINETKTFGPPNSNVGQYYTPIDENDKTLIFESRFESGNLALAYKLSDTEYNCILQNDINTKGHT